jgi:hypothetical protein
LFEHLPAQAGKLSGGLATHFSFGAGRFEFAVARRENVDVAATNPMALCSRT